MQDDAIVVSIVIPMRNEERFVERCLDSILQQIGERDDIEILCIDGDSSDRTRELVQQYVNRDPRVQLLHNPQRIVPTALNLSLRTARGRFVMRLDCHAEYAPDYVEATLAALERTGADIIGGYMTTRPASDTAAGRAIAAATSSRFGVGGSAFRTGGEEQEVDALPFGTFRREVFDRFGEFDERLVRNQDIEFYSRVRIGGGKVMLSPKIRLTYFTRSTFAGLRQQAFNNGMWNPYTVYITGGGLRLRHFVPLAFVLSVVVLSVLGFFWRPAWWLLGVELALYFALALAGAVSIARRVGTSTLLTLAAFVQLHIWYGLGSLWGVLTAPFRFGLKRRSRRVDALPDRRD